jgi:hypothetical protein
MKTWYSGKWSKEHPAAARCSKQLYRGRNRKKEIARVKKWRENNAEKRRRTDAALRARKRDAGQVMLPLTTPAPAPASARGTAE